MAPQYNVRGIPVTFLIYNDKVYYKWTGPISPTRVKEHIFCVVYVQFNLFKFDTCMPAAIPDNQTCWDECSQWYTNMYLVKQSDNINFSIKTQTLVRLGFDKNACDFRKLKSEVHFGYLMQIFAPILSKKHKEPVKYMIKGLNNL